MLQLNLFPIYWDNKSGALRAPTSVGDPLGLMTLSFAPHIGEHLTFTLDGCLCVLDGITNIISKTILGVGLYISAKISMNVFDDELFGNVKKNDKYHDFL